MNPRRLAKNAYSQEAAILGGILAEQPMTLPSGGLQGGESFASPSSFPDIDSVSGYKPKSYYR